MQPAEPRQILAESLRPTWEPWILSGDRTARDSRSYQLRSLTFVLPARVSGAAPCKWQGSLFDPGPSVDDLANALVDIPLRHASAPVDVSIDGYRGKYLEWSVPEDIGTGTTEQEVFEGCDMDGGEHYFESWTGDPTGWGGDRYNQAAGQIDRLWILDVDRVRFVIDAFSMPGSRKKEINTLLNLVESIRFER